jgi:hypothetical protein
MPLPISLWFPRSAAKDRRRRANGLKRATMEAEILEERRINLWLELGRIALSESRPYGPSPKIRDDQVA